MEQGQTKPKINVDILLDTEFNAAIGNFRVDPISIAMVSADGLHVLYGVSSEFNEAAAASRPFLAQHVLPKLPPPEERKSNEEIRLNLEDFFKKVVEESGANRVTIWAKNGSMGDFMLLNLWMEDNLYPFMRSLGVERTYFEDTQKLYIAAGRPDRSSLPELSDDLKHTALGDVLHEQQVFELCQSIVNAPK